MIWGENIHFCFLRKVMCDIRAIRKQCYWVVRESIYAKIAVVCNIWKIQKKSPDRCSLGSRPQPQKRVVFATFWPELVFRSDAFFSYCSCWEESGYISASLLEPTCSREAGLLLAPWFLGFGVSEGLLLSGGFRFFFFLKKFGGGS